MEREFAPADKARAVAEELAEDAASGNAFAAALRESPVPTAFLAAGEPGFPVVFANAAFFHLTGFTESEAIGRPWSFLCCAAADPEEIARVERALEAGRPAHSDGVLCRRRDNSAFWNALHLAPIRGAGGGAGGGGLIVATMTDVTDAQRRRDGGGWTEALAASPARRETELELVVAALEHADSVKAQLMREFHHRQKNSLQLVSALLAIGNRHQRNGPGRDSIEAISRRVSTLFAAHMRDRPDTAVNRIDVCDLLRDIAAYVIDPAIGGRTAIDYDMAPTPVPLGVADGLALLFGEVISAAVAPDRPLRIALRPCGDGILLEVTGAFPSAQDVPEDEEDPAGLIGADAFGTVVVEAMSRQLRARFSIVGASDELRTIRVELPEEPLRGRGGL